MADSRSSMAGSKQQRRRSSAEHHLSDDEGSGGRTALSSQQTERVSNPWLSTSDVLTLDIRGKETVTTLRSTFTFVAGSKLAELFSGRWDATLPKNEKGHFLISRKPELFIPLLDFLESLACMTPSDTGSLPMPPMTPSFSNPNDDIGFRRMVDAYNLTNVLYNYELYSFGKTHVTWSSLSWVSRDVSVLEYAMTATSPEEVETFTLDRPTLSVGPSHNRKVQSFEVAIDGNFVGAIGWIRRGVVAAQDDMSFNKQANRIVLLPSLNMMGFVNNQYDLETQDLPGIAFHGRSNVRCTKNVHSNELEWRLDGNLVASTCSPMATRSFPGLIGWSVPDGAEMIPYFRVTEGSCRVTNIQLEM